MLAVNFDEMPADFAQQRRRTGLVAQKRATAAIGLERAADKQWFAGVERNIVVGEQRGERGAGRGRCKARGHLRAVGTLPHERGVGAHTEREP